MKGERLSQQLREGAGQYLERRRAIVGLSLISVASMSIITLYQMGLIEHLPEPPAPYLDADKVDASAEAYEKLSVPDATLGLLSYAVTIVLAAMGGTDRARSRSYLPLALLAKTLVDATQAGKLTVDQWTKHRTFCSWCVLAAIATFATVPLAVPEARAAYDHYRNR